ncbi:MAG TPA: hypothetical protein VGS28_04325 [Candidatus Saccharimonadales bacterium]|nr:hypothetical protein [Candidatus Saccharimonadales bacterium]
MKSTEPLDAFIDEFERVFEDAENMPPMAGRLLAYLMVCDPPEQTFEALQIALSASAGSVSTMAQLLLDRGLVTRFRPPNSRRDYLSIHRDMPMRLLQGNIRSVLIMHDLAEEGISLVSPENSRVKDFHDLYSMLVEEMPKLIDQWEER